MVSNLHPCFLFLIYQQPYVYVVLLFEKKNNHINNKMKTTKRVKRGGRKWSAKYKKSIDCSAPRGFSQRQYCKYGRRTKT